jgi:diaminopimelate decarboxylase
VQFPPSAGGLPALAESELPAAVRAEILRRAAAGAHVAGGVVDGGYLYLPDVAAGRARALRAVLPDWLRVCFAVKANSYGPVLTALAPQLDGFEVASAAEAQAARTLAPEGLLVAAGPGKSPELLRALVEQRVDVVNVESVLELHRLSQVAAEAGVRVDVALRVNPSRVALGGALAMGGTATAFGVPEPDLPAALDAAAGLPCLRVVGLHVHAVSGVLDAGAYAAYVRWCLEFAAATARARGLELRLVDVGGGIGVPFGVDAPFDLDRLGSQLADVRPPAGVTAVVEPGRYLAADCGWYAAGVIDVKRSYGTAFAVLRGGINHFQLPASWDLIHRFAVVAVDDWPLDVPRPEVRDGLVTVVGELCTPEDTLARDARVERLRAGDVVVFPQAGAYGWEFAMPAFLGHPPATRTAVG